MKKFIILLLLTGCGIPHSNQQRPDDKPYFPPALGRGDIVMLSDLKDQVGIVVGVVDNGSQTGWEWQYEVMFKERNLWAVQSILKPIGHFDWNAAPKKDTNSKAEVSSASEVNQYVEDHSKP